MVLTVAGEEEGVAAGGGGVEGDHGIALVEGVAKLLDGGRQPEPLESGLLVDVVEHPPPLLQRPPPHRTAVGGGAPGLIGHRLAPQQPVHAHHLGGEGRMLLAEDIEVGAGLKLLPEQHAAALFQ